MIIIIIVVIMLLCYYFRLDTGFTILRNVHVLWVRAPLSKQYLKPHFSFDFPNNETDTSQCLLLRSFSFSRARPLHDAPPSRCAFNAYSPASVFARRVKTETFLRDSSVSFRLRLRRVIRRVNVPITEV